MNANSSLQFDASSRYSMVPQTIEEKLFNQQLDAMLKPAVEEGELDFLTDKCFRLELTDMKKHWNFSFKEQQLV